MQLNTEKNDEPLLPAMDVVYSWSTAWPRVIARAWIDEDFKVCLTQSPKKAFHEMGFTGRAIVCGESIDIWDLLEIEVIDGSTSSHHTIEITTNSKKSQYVPPELNPKNPYKFNGWSNAIDHQQLKMYLTLILPPAPAQKWQATAINDWSAAGKVFPITLPCFC